MSLFLTLANDLALSYMLRCVFSGMLSVCLSAWSYEIAGRGFVISYLALGLKLVTLRGFYLNRTEINNKRVPTEAYICVVIIYNRERLCSLLVKNRRTKQLAVQTSRLLEDHCL